MIFLRSLVWEQKWTIALLPDDKVEFLIFLINMPYTTTQYINTVAFWKLILFGILFEKEKSFVRS